jgi:hypothetical protein
VRHKQTLETPGDEPDAPAPLTSRLRLSLGFSPECSAFVIFTLPISRSNIACVTLQRSHRYTSPMGRFWDKFWNMSRDWRFHHLALQKGDSLPPDDLAHRGRGRANERFARPEKCKPSANGEKRRGLHLTHPRGWKPYRIKCRWPDSNRQGACTPADFKLSLLASDFCRFSLFSGPGCRSMPVSIFVFWQSSAGKCS